MSKSERRKPVACTACHLQKLKCSGDTPCARCIHRGRDCIYPKKEKLITVPESYLREIEARASIGNQFNTLRESQTRSSQFDSARSSFENDELLVTDHLRVDCPVEHFVQKLKDLSSLLHPFLQSESCQPLELSKDSKYVYFRLKADTNASESLVKLPLQNQVMDLIRVFEETNGNYHWYLRERFRERIHQTYSHPTGQTGDRDWFCQLLVVVAIAQAQKHQSKSSLESVSALSGSDLFGQVASLFKVTEVPSTEDIETLNLMAFYYHTVNRPKMAFVYINQSITLLKLFHLDKTTTSQDEDENRHDNTNPCAVEHMLRLWWTAFCLERKLATTLGILSEHGNTLRSQGIALPSSDNLLPKDLAQFFDLEALLENVQVVLERPA